MMKMPRNPEVSLFCEEGILNLTPFAVCDSWCTNRYDLLFESGRFASK